MKNLESLTIWLFIFENAGTLRWYVSALEESQLM